MLLKEQIPAKKNFMPTMWIKNSPKIIYEPDEYIVRISGLKKEEITSMNKPELPKRQGYNQEREHFRTIKFVGRKVIIVDGT